MAGCEQAYDNSHLISQLQNGKARDLASREPGLRSGINMHYQQCLRTHQDLCKREGINSPNPSWCLSHCFPLSLPSPDPKQLPTTAVVLASTPLRLAVQKMQSNTCNPILKQLLLQMQGYAWQSCSTSQCFIPAEIAELLICLSLQVTKPQKNGATVQSPIQLQYVTDKTANTSLLEDRNNIMLT